MFVWGEAFCYCCYYFNNNSICLLATYLTRVLNVCMHVFMCTYVCVYVYVCVFVNRQPVFSVSCWTCWSPSSWPSAFACWSWRPWTPRCASPAAFAGFWAPTRSRTRTRTRSPPTRGSSSSWPRNRWWMGRGLWVSSGFLLLLPSSCYFYSVFVVRFYFGVEGRGTVGGCFSCFMGFLMGVQYCGFREILYGVYTFFLWLFYLRQWFYWKEKKKKSGCFYFILFADSICLLFHLLTWTVKLYKISDCVYLCVSVGAGDDGNEESAAESSHLRDFHEAEGCYWSVSISLLHCVILCCTVKVARIYWV